MTYLGGNKYLMCNIGLCLLDHVSGAFQAVKSLRVCKERPNRIWNGSLLLWETYGNIMGEISRAKG